MARQAWGDVRGGGGLDGAAGLVCVCVRGVAFTGPEVRGKRGLPFVCWEGREDLGSRGEGGSRASAALEGGGLIGWDAF